jgi:hypothetical protein
MQSVSDFDKDSVRPPRLKRFTIVMVIIMLAFGAVTLIMHFASTNIGTCTQAQVDDGASCGLGKTWCGPAGNFCKCKFSCP